MDCRNKRLLLLRTRSKLTHWGWDKMIAILQTTFSNAFSWMKMHGFWLRFHWNSYLRVQLTIFQHWIRYWFGAAHATSHYRKQWWLVCWCIYASLGLNGLKIVSWKWCGRGRYPSQLMTLNDHLWLHYNKKQEKPNSLSCEVKQLSVFCKLQSGPWLNKRMWS